MDCFMIGRDLVRLLQNVARIPEFEQLWKDIIHNPQVLSAQFTGRQGPQLSRCWSPASHRQPPPTSARPHGETAVTVSPLRSKALAQRLTLALCAPSGRG